MALAVRGHKRYPESPDADANTAESLVGLLAVMVPANVGIFTASLPFALRLGLLALVYGTAFTAMVVGVARVLAAEDGGRSASVTGDSRVADDD